VASAKDARPPGVPTLGELKVLNRRIHDDAGTPERFKLDQPSPLTDCLSRAGTAYNESPDGIVETAAILAHGIAQAQSFVDGNRRTAYSATQFFLVENGFGHLTSQTKSDHTLARYLNQVVEPADGTESADAEKFKRLFKRRLKERKAPAKEKSVLR
jgi:prophage maintenance system killer protein